MYYSLSSRRTNSARVVLRVGYGTPGPLVVLACIFAGLLSGCGLMERPTHFELCMDRSVPTPEKAQCKELLDVTVNARINKLSWNPINGSYFGLGGPDFRIHLPEADERRLLSSDSGKAPWVNIRGESHEVLFARWLSSNVATGECVVNQPVGEMLLVDQDCYDVLSRRKHEPVASYYVPLEANGEKLQTCIKTLTDPDTKSPWSVQRRAMVENGTCGSPVAWFVCAEPRGGIAKQPGTGNGCTVHAEFRPNFHLSYQIRYRHLKDWKSIHDDVLQQLSTLITINERGEKHGQ